MTDGTLDTTGPQPAVRLERRLPDPPAERCGVGRLPGPAGRAAGAAGRLAAPVPRVRRGVRAGHRPAGGAAGRVHGEVSAD
jgi:hypothetical protein